MVDREHSLIISGTGDVLELDDGIIGAGSSAKSGRYFYYGCQSLLKSGEGICQVRLVPRAKLGGAVIRQLKRQVLTEGDLKSLVCMMNE